MKLEELKNVEKDLREQIKFLNEKMEETKEIIEKQKLEEIAEKLKLANDFCHLALIIKFDVVNIHGISVLDAHFLQTGKQTAFTQLQVEVVSGFIIIEVDILDQTLQPKTGNNPSVAQMLNGQLIGIAGLGQGSHIFRLVDRYRG